MPGPDAPGRRQRETLDSVNVAWVNVAWAAARIPTETDRRDHEVPRVVAAMAALDAEVRHHAKSSPRSDRVLLRSLRRTLGVRLSYLSSKENVL